MDWIILIGVAGLVCYWLRAAFLAREAIGFVSKNLAHAAIVFLLTLFILGTVGQGSIPRVQQVPFAGLIAIVFLIVQQSKKRSRHIPGSIRKAVIARDLKGARFNSRKHHIDHVWPFSLGGSHSLDNLRVIDKNTNLKKGAKRPRFRDMW